jgi:hypothetical protein
MDTKIIEENVAKPNTDQSATPNLKMEGSGY